jgi:hypothetical protein
MKSIPQSPSELRQALVRIFPALPRDFGAQGESVFEDAGPTYHSVMRDFAHFFGRNVDQFSGRQFGRLSELVIRSMATAGPLRDAMETCFLEHNGLKVDRRIEPFLTAARKGSRP